jgi:hypothetical protein
VEFFSRAREFFPDPRIFILIPDTLHALLAQRINNAAPAPMDRGRPPHAYATMPGEAALRGNGAPPEAGCAVFTTPCATRALKVQKGKLREMAEALLH